jgi:hypothetical protein
MFSTILLAIFLLSLVTNWYSLLVKSLMIVLLVMVLDKLGKGIVLREMIAFHSAFICLAMPLLGYAQYTRVDTTARLWVRYMLVPEDVYFGFALPAVSAFVFAICLPLTSRKSADHGEHLNALVARVKAILKQPQIKIRGIYIIIIGLVMLFLSNFLPVEVRFIAVLFFFAAFAGVLYVYYSESFRFRVPVLVAFILFIMANALRSGMFTMVAYMGITMFSFIFLGTKTNFIKKTFFFLIGVFILFLIQSVKPDYRAATWGNEQSRGESNAEIFVGLLSEKLSGGSIFSKQAFFWIYYRTNQGFNVSLVMRRIPRVQPFDGGIHLMRAAASSLVPRFLWPDKPEAGGKFNMKYYAGRTIKGWSTNVGPLGEAYGSFGRSGGIIFMLCLGFFIRWAYKRAFIIARRIPLVICWLPVLFYQVTYSAETDTLQIMNSLVKSATFMWVLYNIVPGWFNAVKSGGKKVVMKQHPHISQSVS